MELLEFRDNFLAEVTTRANADKNLMHSAFAERCGELLEESEELYDFAPSYYRGSGYRNRNLGVDGYAFDDADGSVRIVIAEYSGEVIPQTLTQTQARQLFSRVQAFVEDALEGRLKDTVDESTPEYGLGCELEARVRTLARFRFYLVTDWILSERVKDWPEGELRGVPIEFHIWDMSRFHRAFESKSGRDELIVNFADISLGGLTCIPASVDADSYSAYLCIIPGEVLADIYDTYGSRLLEGNVRSFLSTGVKVNKGLRTTILKEPSMFFAYNNGIAATASEIKVDDSGGSLKLLEAKDFQIVNGGQTTASLSNSRRRDSVNLNGIFVQMKISVVNDDQSGSIIPLISRYANSQNKVSEADFFSNHEYHRRIESISRRLRAPARKGSQIESFWFYERTRGQYSAELGRMAAPQQRRFQTDHSKEQVITKTDLAKAENSWRQLPHFVSRGSQKNFLNFAEYVTVEWERNQEQFSDEHFKAVVVHRMIFQRLEKLIPRQEWYDGGYRAQIVAYTVAKLANLIDKEAPGQALNIPGIWRQQVISEALEAQLLLIAEAMYDVIISPEAGIQNVGEWAKKELAWQRATAVEVPLLSSFAAELADKADEQSRLREGREGMKIVNALDETVAVMEYGFENWERLRIWANERAAISPKEDSILRVATNPLKIPSDRQSSAILQIKARLESEGFSQ